MDSLKRHRVEIDTIEPVYNLLSTICETFFLINGTPCVPGRVIVFACDCYIYKWPLFNCPNT